MDDAGDTVRVHGRVEFVDDRETLVVVLFHTSEDLPQRGVVRQTHRPAVESFRLPHEDEAPVDQLCGGRPGIRSRPSAVQPRPAVCQIVVRCGAHRCSHGAESRQSLQRSETAAASLNE